jgi:chemotaxis protein histidine kinase CheA
MTQIDLSSYRDLYLKTAKEYLEKLSADLELLKTNSSDSEAIADAHLCAHSIGSQSLTMQYTSTGNLARALEHFLNSVKEQQTQINQDELDTLTLGASKLAESVSSIETHNSELNLETETQNIKQKLNIE